MQPLGTVVLGIARVLFRLCHVQALKTPSMQAQMRGKALLSGQVPE
jgi:hypothetical protein